MSSQTRPKYCLNCGTQLAEGERFCPNCGREATPQAIGDDRRTISYILGILIIGLGHMVVRKYARGIAFFLVALFVGGAFIWWLGWIGLLVFGLPWLVFSEYDLYRVNNRRPLSY